jgi:uncharacterized damage-inducible protein DinB
MPEIDAIKRVQLDRLRGQFAGLERIVGRFDKAGLNRPPTDGKWSVREHVAHLARYHEIFLERLSRILYEDRPRFDRYRAENDAQWKEWQSLPVDAALERLRSSHAEVTRRLEQLPDDQFSRVATHPVFGALNLGDWLEFFLIHEAHHTYAIFMLWGEQRG